MQEMPPENKEGQLPALRNILVNLFTTSYSGHTTGGPLRTTGV
jgi:hypothetical protein